MRIVYERLTLQTDVAFNDEQTGGFGLSYVDSKKRRVGDISSKSDL